jgi:hypothetical protein
MVRNWRAFVITLTAFTGCCLGGCASIKSTKIETSASTPDGLVYYLPTQQLELTLTVTDKERSIDLAPTTVVPDITARYVVRYERNQIGTNVLLVGIGTNGLLTGDGSGSTTGQITEVLQGLVSTLGALHSREIHLTDLCKTPGVYRWVFDPFNMPAERDWGRCGLEVDATTVDGADITPTSNYGLGVSAGKVHGTGYFYRQALPLRVVVTDADETKVFYPSIVSHRSPTHFLPIPKTLFATTSWKITFSNGIPTLYEVHSGGDALGLVKLPADIISAYSTAVTAGFTQKKGATTEEIAYLAELNKLAVQQAKLEACQAAVRGGDLKAINEACN